MVVAYGYFFKLAATLQIDARATCKPPLTSIESNDSCAVQRFNAIAIEASLRGVASDKTQTHGWYKLGVIVVAALAAYERP